MTTQVQFVRLMWGQPGLAGQIEVKDMTVNQALNRAFDAFNRGSGSEVEFNGPSASVGDLFIVVKDGDHRYQEVWQIASFGFTQIKCKGYY